MTTRLRFDDWFRPYPRDGSAGPRRPRDGRDRVWSLAMLLAMLASTAFYAAAVHPRSDGIGRGLLPIGLALVQLVFLFRTRHLGWRRQPLSTTQNRLPDGSASTTKSESSS
ncbi:MAG: hypothetical protein JWN77_2207 [Frankiales bacterium]|nr:hypothetical protein [Frankiales bacterium]